MRAELRASLEQFSRALPIEASVWEAFAERIETWIQEGLPPA